MPEEHLRRADPVLGGVIDEVLREAGGAGPALPPDAAGPRDPDIPADPYGVIVRAIVSQNISSFASRSIYRRLIERFGGRLPTPEEVLAHDPDELRRSAGLSRAKTLTLRSLADNIASGELRLDQLHELSDEDVIDRLSAVRGIGVWTADMFLIFHLYRPDVLPVGDLELRRTVERVYRLPQRLTPAGLVRIADPWRPYRSLACLYLWQHTEKTPRL
jgi:DNA-3-methyladenine glycosylase II